MLVKRTAVLRVFLILVSLLLAAGLFKVLHSKWSASRELRYPTIDSVRSALFSYYADHGDYPESLDQLTNVLITSNEKLGPYWTYAGSLVDQYRRPFHYHRIQREEFAAYELRSYGRDRRLNTDDDLAWYQTNRCFTPLYELRSQSKSCK